MARRVFYSFHFDGDCMRSNLVRNMGAIDGNKPAHSNDWEQVKRAGDQAIKNWIDGQLQGRSCTIVLVGAKTADRPWVQYEIQRSWSLRKGLFGIYIHNLRDPQRGQSAQGANPFARVWPSSGHVVPIHAPPSSDSQQVYAYIAANIESWIDQAVAFRASQS